MTDVQDMVPARTRRVLVSAALSVAAAVGLSVLPPQGAVALSGTSASLAAAGRSTAMVPAAVRAPSSYAFATVLDGKPVRWNPCAPIRWTSNTARGPAGGLAVLRASVARIAALTGTTWQYVGPTSRVPSSRYLPGRASSSYPPVLIGWTDGAKSDLLRGRPANVLGMSRTAWFGVQTRDGRKHAATRAAVIALDRTNRLPLRGPSSWSAVTLHELGHTMGLAHVGDTRQLMATVLPRNRAGLQAGDRKGLARLGRSAGCVVVPS